MKKILDKHISFDNFATFKRCQILAQGQVIRFILMCGVQYDVPVEYLAQWSPHPHYALVNEELQEWKKLKVPPLIAPTVSAVKCRRVLLRTAVHIYLSNNAIYEIPWDSVLMACEPRYEHFGGWTEESKHIVETWHNNVRENAPNTRQYRRKLRICRIKRQRMSQHILAHWQRWSRFHYRRSRQRRRISI